MLIQRFPPLRPAGLVRLVLAVSTLASFVHAQNVYHIRADATGRNDGSDWINAYPSIPQSLQRGATYFVADGIYPGASFNDAESGQTLISIKKATEQLHGTSVGWRSDYGDGQAVITSGLTFTTGYWLFDGAKRNEGDWSDSSAYGFHVKYSGNGTGVKLLRFDMGAGRGNVTVSNTAFTHSGGSGPNGSDGRDIVYSLGGLNNVMSRCLFYNAGRTHFLYRSCTGYVVEYSWIDKNESQAIEHAESCSALNSPKCIFRFNRIRNIQGTGVLVFGQNSDGWKIYGNVVSNWTTPSNGVFTGWTAENARDAEIYNNTIVDCANGRIGFVNDSGFITYNNIFIGTPRVAFGGSQHKHDYNVADVYLDEVNGKVVPSSIFVDYKGGDFRLVTPVISGMSLGPPYDKDPLGKTRGADGVWDVGAYEFVADGAASLPSPSPAFSPTPAPTSLQGAPSEGFVVGDQVLVNANPSLRVRSTPALAGTILGNQPYRTLGTIIGGPVMADGYTWWQINYESAPDGWSIEGDLPYLILASAPTLPTAPTGLHIVP